MATETPQPGPSGKFEPRLETPVGGPTTTGWREGALTRAKELESQCAVMMADGNRRPNAEILATGLNHHVDAVRDAADRYQGWRFRFFRYGSLMERALSNLSAAEANLLSIAPDGYVIGQMPGLLRHVRAHLTLADPRREEFERVARRLGVTGRSDSHSTAAGNESGLIEEDRVRIVAITRGASTEALREQVRIRSFRNILAVTTIGMTFIGMILIVVGFVNPALVPMCFAPEEAGQAVVVCPTEQSGTFPVSSPPSSDEQQQDIDASILEAAKGYDILVVELVGLVAAGIAAAAAIRGIRGSSERYGVPVMLAALKLPTGAVTAVLGVVLMRGDFVPGLSALDSSAQVLAWALLFGYAQQLFTRLVDRQGQTVLNSVRGAGKPPGPPAAT